VNAPALIVLGSSVAAGGGTYRISRGCRRLVAEAARDAVRLRARLVVFSGWSPGDGPSEAAQMRALWPALPGIEAVVEETASTTAENAARTLPLLLERGVTEAVVFCAPLHLLRARWIFRSVYHRHGVDVHFDAAPVAPTLGALAWELAALAVTRRQLRAVHAELTAHE
jgi:uncharacterized SAM-binding protein YcdF (DUF218 family)